VRNRDSLGGGLVFIFILVLWALVDVILGVIYMVTGVATDEGAGNTWTGSDCIGMA
jgi:uncharacterized membrane protein